MFLKKTNQQKVLQNPLAALSSFILLSILAPLNAISAGAATAQSYTADPGPTEGQCEMYASDYGHGDLDGAIRIKGCCDRVFRDAPLNAHAQTIVADHEYLAAAQGQLLCIDEYKLGKDPSAKPSFLRRNVITGSNTKLSNTSALIFQNDSSTPALIVADEVGGNSQIHAFNYLLDGNVGSDRELGIKSAPKTVGMTLDEKANELILLGTDGILRMVSLNYNDYSLKKEDHARVDQWIQSASPIGNPVAVAYSERLERILVLTDDGLVHLFGRTSQGKVELESALQATDLKNPSQLSVMESDKSDTVTIVVKNANGESLSFNLKLNSSSSAGSDSSGDSGSGSASS